ncbi:MAG: hypothetical protein BRD51_01105 [Bacteroidetes bacterium SW_11_64_17]|nr:MAG: hypothetical protein BRD51_01105 [Bacteroidetes bacterium SW_11_64_17]
MGTVLHFAHCVSVTYPSAKQVLALFYAPIREDDALRDAQVVPIWEETMNVLTLDLLRTVNDVGGLEPLGAEFEHCLTVVGMPRLQRAACPALENLRCAR